MQFSSEQFDMKFDAKTQGNKDLTLMGDSHKDPEAAVRIFQATTKLYKLSWQNMAKTIQ